MPDKQTILTAAVVLAAVLLIAAGGLFVYPMLTAGGSTTPGEETTTPVTVTTTRPIVIGTVIPFQPTVRPVPAKGVFVHINYLGGFEGSYGMSDALTTVPGNSGDRLWEVENANGTVLAEFKKQDGSPRELLVEIYKDGKTLTGGTTTVGHGSVALSVDTITGIAAPPITSGNASSVAKPAAAASKTTNIPMTTVPAASTISVTTTIAANTTTAAP
jgi:hypothetical protein